MTNCVCFQVCITDNLQKAQTFARSNAPAASACPTQFYAVPIPEKIHVGTRRPRGRRSRNPPTIPKAAFPSRALLSWPERDYELSQKTQFADESSSDEKDTLPKRVCRRRLACDSHDNEGASTSAPNNSKCKDTELLRKRSASSCDEPNNPQHEPKRRCRRGKRGGRRRRAACQNQESKDACISDPDNSNANSIQDGAQPDASQMITDSPAQNGGMCDDVSDDDDDITVFGSVSLKQSSIIINHD